MSKFSKVFSAQPYQLEGNIITVEIDVSVGLHAFILVGLPDKSVEESRERVGAALKHSGYSSPRHSNCKTTVALAPAELRKEGSYFDVAIAIGYLLAQEELVADCSDCVFVGELSLNGDIRPVKGALAIAQTAYKKGFTKLFVPAANAAEAALVEGIAVYGCATLKDVIYHLDSDKKFSLTITEPCTTLPPLVITIDFSDIKGQESAKRALEIAAAGGHNIALFGPPGTGKTLLAKALPFLLPPLSFDDALEVSTIHSIAGILREPLITHAPIRAPHHTASYVSIVGGGADIKPGEITLAHKGILFMDEFPEFDSKVLESLRQPLEDHIITISRARGTARYPADCMLVAALNPCPCGYKGSTLRACICTQGELQRYMRKLSGPIVDRIELWVSVDHIDFEKIEAQTTSEHTKDIALRVIDAQNFACARAKKLHIPKINSRLQAQHMQLIPIEPAARTLLIMYAKKLSLSHRSYHRIIKVARTIADLAHSELITEAHILEAFQYRPKGIVDES